MLRCAGSGGEGESRGGDGVVRELEFLRPLTVSILSERRAVAPFGILGGLPAAKGVNLWVKKDGRVISLGGKATVEVSCALLSFSLNLSVLDPWACCMEGCLHLPSRVKA